jgi:hypothetical protein
MTLLLWSRYLVLLFVLAMAAYGLWLAVTDRG